MYRTVNAFRAQHQFEFPQNNSFFSSFILLINFLQYNFFSLVFCHRIPNAHWLVHITKFSSEIDQFNYIIGVGFFSLFINSELMKSGRCEIFRISCQIFIHSRFPHCVNFSLRYNAIVLHF